MVDTEETAKAIAASLDTNAYSKDLHTGHATMEQKVIACTAYIFEGGNSKKAAEIAGVHYNSVLAWKKQEWWGELKATIAKDHQEDLKARLGQLASKSLDVVEDRLENGDQIMNYKTGQMERKPIPGKEATIMFGVLADKARVMDNLPTSITHNTSETERLNNLKSWFESLAEKTVNAKNNAIEGEYTRG